MQIWLLCTLALLVHAGASAQEFDLFVSDAGEFDQGPWQILKYDQDGQNGAVFIDQNLGWPQDILFLDDGTVLISNLTTNRIDRYDSETGDFINLFAIGISQPTRMKIGADGLLYVLQWAGSGLVKRYQLDGTFVDDFTSVGVPNSIGLDWDEQGNLYVSSFNQALVRRFDPDGNDLGVFINSNLVGPTNIWFDAAGDLLVADWSGTSVKRFDANGNFEGNYITGLSQVEGVDFLPNGNLLLGNGSTGSVREYNPAGVFQGNFVAPGSAGLIRPNAVRIRPRVQGFVINQGLNDAWFNPTTNGQGFFIIVFENIPLVFLAWFTYDTERPPEDVEAILGDPGHRWITAQGGFEGDTAELAVVITRGGVFDSGEPAPENEFDGTMTVTFTSCTAGSVAYDIPSLGLMGEVPIQRIANDNVPLCEAMP